MATKTKRTKRNHKRGFGSQPEPKLGTGYSKAYSHALQALVSKQYQGIPVREAVEYMRRGEFEDRHHYNFKRTDPFTPKFSAPDGEVHILTREYNGGERSIRFSAGLWQLSFSMNGVNDRRPVFTINTWCGPGYLHHADQIQIGMTKEFGRETYDRWRHAVMEDWASLVAVMHAGCKWLENNGRQYAYSWSSSERSERLLRKLGIRVTNDGLAMLFGHYERDLFDCRDKTPQLEMGEAMLAAGKTAQEIFRAIASGAYIER